MTFTAIDFELATAAYNSVCAVGIVKVVDDEIVEQFHSLVRPPDNKYMWQTTRVHGIKPKDTAEAPTFLDLYPTIAAMLRGSFMVAHNEKFDREVLIKTMAHYGLDYKDLALKSVWECTSNIYRIKGFKKTKLSICCKIMGIDLHHHDPLSDAKASAQLYLLQDRVTAALIAQHFPADEPSAI
ncbi:exonuclease domain-containing protein [Sphingobacterium oryzagri]|uniref:Exonuclease domain-containing protein n=1 Tax=Sphingobacterium oryzagri TaxID=3025669 RepID=A0ABY7WK13_9SPHI|nr:exonuclease domain-containing protein [Sphingobacterium sp. KACC 22765]WDF68952.1 exonuclease domain-containing protein [Sphingobacterium sp. KACC 22765]